MVKNLIFIFLVVFFLASCRNKKEDMSFNLNELNDIFISDEEGTSEVKNNFYETKTVLYKNEKDIWINTNHPEIYDSILTFFNFQFKSAFSDTVLNSWVSNSKEIMLFQKSDSLILITILDNK